MSINRYSTRATFGLLPEPERSPASYVTSAIINTTILAVVLYVGMTAKRVIQEHKYEQTELIFPTTPPPPPLKMKMPPPPKIETPKLPEVKLEAPKINMPKVEPKPDLKPVQMESKVALPVVKAAKPAIILAPQPKAALTAAAPAQVAQAKPSTAPVHFGETFGVTPNPNASRPATVAAIGNPYGGMNGPAVAPKGVVGSTGIGNGTTSGSNAGVVGKVASAGIPGSTGTANSAYAGKVAAAGIPAMQTQVAAAPAITAVPKSTNLEVLSKPAVNYTSEARQLRVQGDVVLRVTFTAAGQVLVQGVVHGLGHGLDEEARRVASGIRFRPATRNGQAVDLTTNITITFQLA
ncbi:MAG TPA: energy transducer TonB [Terracidiphilus sp.]|jgi:TonB family protein